MTLRKGKISAQINPWRIVDFSSDILCTIVAQSWKVPDIWLIGHSLLKVKWKKNSRTMR